MAPLPLQGIDTMILAAGFGRRMQPLTDALPKPLLPVLGRPLLAWNLRVLASLGAEKVVINAHHQSELLEAFLDRELPMHFADSGAPRVPEIRLVREPVILGTAGGIANAAPLLASDPCLIWNVDLLYRPDLAAALALHRKESPAATLVLTKSPLHAKIELEGTRIRRVRENADPSDSSLRAYTGVILLSQKALQELPRGDFAELPPFLRGWADGKQLRGFDEDALFLEVGTMESYLRVHRWIAERPELLPGPAPDGITRVDAFGYIDPGAQVAADASIEDSVILGGTRIAAGASVRRSIVGKGATAEGETFARALAGSESTTFPILDREVESRLTAFLKPHAKLWPREVRKLPRSFLPLHGDGSGRRLVRVVAGAHSHVAILPAPEVEAAASVRADHADRSSPDHPASGSAPPAPIPIYPRREGPDVPDEPATFVYVARLLRSRGVRVPEIRAYDETSGLLLVEDLGEQLLLDVLNGGKAETSRAHYRNAIDILCRLRRPEGDPFDPDAVYSPTLTADFARQFECGYFEREMAGGWAGLEPANAALEAEYDEIAAGAFGSEEPVLVHRDFQSRNLMVVGGDLAVIDFQGARLGPPLYDLASLLFDPYAPLEDELREELRESFFERARIAPSARETFVPVALSRLLQTLGAFAFLGGRLGKSGFLEHAPRALAHVRALAGDRYPHLHTTASKIEDRFATPTETEEDAQKE